MKIVGYNQKYTLITVSKLGIVPVIQMANQVLGTGGMIREYGVNYI